MLYSGCLVELEKCRIHWRLLSCNNIMHRYMYVNCPCDQIIPFGLIVSNITRGERVLFFGWVHFYSDIVVQWLCPPLLLLELDCFNVGCSLNVTRTFHLQWKRKCTLFNSHYSKYFSNQCITQTKGKYIFSYILFSQTCKIDYLSCIYYSPF